MADGKKRVLVVEDDITLQETRAADGDLQAPLQLVIRQNDADIGTANLEREHPGTRPRLSMRTAAFATVLVLALLALAVSWWTQRQRRPELLFLGWDEAGRVQIFRTEVDGPHVQQLTYAEQGVQDYTLSPDRGSIAYSTTGSQGSTLELVEPDGGDRRQLLSCSPAVCNTIVWHPDGKRLTYERRDLDDQGIPGFPRLWWLDITTGRTTTVLEDEEQVSSGASFSPDGRWLSYIGSPGEGLFVFDFETGRLIQFPNEVGTPAVWSPDGTSLLFRNNEVVVAHSADDDDHQGHSHDFALGVHLFLANLEDETTISLSEEAVVDDASPAWQPNGEWIAFGRKQPRTEMGRQLWLMRPNGSEAYALTDDPAVHHGVPTWSEDGQSLLFQRFPVFEADAGPSIWLYSLNAEDARQIVSAGFQPAWLP